LGSALDPTEGAYSAPPDPLAGLRSPISKGEEREGRGAREKRGVEGDGRDPPFCKFLDPPLSCRIYDKKPTVCHNLPVFNIFYQLKDVDISTKLQIEYLTFSKQKYVFNTCVICIYE